MGHSYVETFQHCPVGRGYVGTFRQCPVGRS